MRQRIDKTTVLASIISIAVLMATAPALGETSSYTLRLRDALTIESVRPGGVQLTIAVESSDTSITRTAAVAPWYSNLPHEVNAENLVLNEFSLSGTITCEIRGENTVQASYTIEAVVEESNITGTFTGTFGSDPVAGALHGERHSTSLYSESPGVELWFPEAMEPGTGKQKEGWDLAHASVRFSSGHSNWARIVPGHMSIYNLPEHENEGLMESFIPTSYGPVHMGDERWYAKVTENSLTLNPDGTFSGVLSDSVKVFSSDPRYAGGV